AFKASGSHRKLYRFSPDDYTEIDKIWTGTHPAGGDLEVVDGPPEGGQTPDLPEVTEEFAPGIGQEELAEIAKRLLPSLDRVQRERGRPRPRSPSSRGSQTAAPPQPLVIPTPTIPAIVCAGVPSQSQARQW